MNNINNTLSKSIEFLMKFKIVKLLAQNIKIIKPNQNNYWFIY